jgi:toxin ParE1/3/4
MSYTILFAPEAEEQLAQLYHYLADVASPDIAATYTECIVTYCENLHVFPVRGTGRDDVRPGLRITNYKKRVVIAFSVEEAEKTVFIIGFFYGGQNYEALLHEGVED